MTETIGVVIITHRSKQHLSHSLPLLLASSLQPRVMVVNSSSQDGTVEEAERLGAETWVIPRASFNHGATREQARQRLGTDIVVMMTPDAYVVDASMLELLVEPLLSQRASVSYGRQAPRENAGFLEAFARQFNYPTSSHVRGIEDVSRFGVYTFFCSNSWAAYRNCALNEIGGFPTTLMSEDALATAALLRRGHKIAYVAEAVVRHSHDYTLVHELQRYFDTGYVRAKHAQLIDFGVTDSQRGRQYFVELNRLLLKERPSLLPYAWTQTVAKWLGYQMGRFGSYLPVAIAKRLSSQDYYWSSEHFRGL